MEDLDRVTSRPEYVKSQQIALNRLGIDWDGPVLIQSDRFEHHSAAVQRLAELDLTYPCFCSRREIAQAVTAPNGPNTELAYPGTCRSLSTQERRRKQLERPAAIRLRSPESSVTFEDAVLGTISGTVDDFVLVRNDGIPAYNLAVVVDDAFQGVTEVVRGDDLVSSTPRQVLLARLLDAAPVRYAHVPLAVAKNGDRLAKRHGAVTLADLESLGYSDSEVVRMLAESLGLTTSDPHPSASNFLPDFDIHSLTRGPWIPPTLR
jgi:glutamyl-tRNA synthetase